MKKIVLEREVVKREWPVNLENDDRSLFEHEIERTIDRVESLELDQIDFFSNGYLSVINHFYPLEVSFQSPPRKSLSRLKAILKTLWMRFRAKHLPFSFAKTALVITNEFSNGYFHWIADCLPKLVVLKDQLADFVLVLPGYMEKFDFVKESLSTWPELEFTFTKENEIRLLPKVYVFPVLALTGNYRVKEINDLRSHFRDFFGLGEGDRKLYVSRKKAPARKIRNEEQLESILKEFGFECVVLEELSWSQQVKLISQARYLVSNHGAGLTNVLFMSAGSRVLEIRHFNDRENNCYFSLVSALGLRYYYCKANPVDSTEAIHTADLWIDEHEIRENIKNFLLK